VEELTCRLLPFEIADGPTNMATDEVLLHAAVSGVATLRFYGWSPATVSLGYFQRNKVRLVDPVLAQLPFVRRPSGGGTLVHHHEVTYALALPAGRTIAMHPVISLALARLGIQTMTAASCLNSAPHASLCFQQITCGDLTIRGSKVVGSAQRKRQGAMLQHGAILCAQSPHTPILPGIRELTGCALTSKEVIGAICEVFAETAGPQMIEQVLTKDETEDRKRLQATRYATDAWNCKR
jgi:lipoate-protein ligase A